MTDIIFYITIFLSYSLVFTGGYILRSVMDKTKEETIEFKAGTSFSVGDYTVTLGQTGITVSKVRDKNYD
jgi:hypothetical protein